MSSDFIEDFWETDMFASHLNLIFSHSVEPLPWDKENAYTRDAIELYYEAGSGAVYLRRNYSNFLQGAGESFGDVETYAAEYIANEIASVEKDLTELGEYPYDQGGNFIINGSEKERGLQSFKQGLELIGLRMLTFLLKLRNG